VRFNKSETAHVEKRVPLDEALLERIEAITTPLAEKERDEAMVRAIDEMPADYAMPLKLRFMDDMPLNRIAAFMGVPLSTVKWRIYHGKKLLRAKLE
jgi:RNA polymerase sigma-70 factor (ECF subfamily)